MTYNGGLATVKTTEVSDGRRTLKVGDVRVLDLVGKGKEGGTVGRSARLKPPEGG